MSRDGRPAKASAGERFGQIAIRKGFVSRQQVEEALAFQKELALQGHPHKLIGMILLERGALGTTELIEVLRDLRAPGVPGRDARPLSSRR